MGHRLTLENAEGTLEEEVDRTPTYTYQLAAFTAVRGERTTHGRRGCRPLSVIDAIYAAAGMRRRAREETQAPAGAMENSNTLAHLHGECAVSRRAERERLRKGLAHDVVHVAFHGLAQFRVTAETDLDAVGDVEVIPCGHAGCG